MKKLLLLMVAIALSSAPAFAVDTDDLPLSATFTAQNELVLTAEAVAADLVEVGGVGYTDEKIAGLQLMNNSSSGFTLTVGSSNDGELVNAAVSAGVPGREAPYTISLVEPASGLGSVTTDTLTGISLATDAVITYTVNPDPTAGGPTNALFDVQITLAGIGAWPGTYGDTITFTIADL